MFAQWAVVCFGAGILISKKSPHFWETLFQQLGLCINIDKNGLAYIFGVFFHKRIWSKSYDFRIYNYNASSRLERFLKYKKLLSNRARLLKFYSSGVVTHERRIGSWSPCPRVTRWVLEKIAQNETLPISCQNYVIHDIFRGKMLPKHMGYFCNFP
jgi:hypothetical protein